MKVSGFTIVRNARKYDYPVVESILSALPLCDEMIVSIGNSDDNTVELIQSIQSPKIRIVHSVWDETLREGGKLLAVETNKAKQHVSPDADWCLYIQADEVLHEEGYVNLRQAMGDYLHQKSVEGLVLNYRHFYGSYQYVADAYNWYRREVRIIRNSKHISSWGDAQGFRRQGKKLSVKPVDAYVHHYGWVKNPKAQQRKQESFHKMWHSDEWVEQKVLKADEFDYSKIDSLQLFTGTHPSVMQKRIAEQNWQFEFDTSKSRMKWKYRVRKWLEENVGVSIGEYRNYKLI
ncbi:MAG: glycosyltransferase family 2 protein [Chitinophagales bacterium]|nr:glycosyltransferase family 2 protein [Chitinophagales bacterium]